MFEMLSILIIYSRTELNDKLLSIIDYFNLI